MRIAYFLTSYLYLNVITSPTREWIDKVMIDKGIDPETYVEFTYVRIALMAILFIGAIVGEITSHRFFIAQTAEEAKFPYKPQRSLQSFFVAILLMYYYPENRFIHFFFL